MNVSIAEMKATCERFGLKAEQMPQCKSRLTQPALAERLQHYRQTISVTNFFVRKFLQSLQGTPIFVVLTDDEGAILSMNGDETIRQTVEQLGIEIGILYQTEEMGNNTIQLCLQQQQLAMLRGDEHFFTAFHQSACYSAPIRELATNRIIGTLSMMTALNYESAYLPTMLTLVCDSVERELQLRSNNADLHVLNQLLVNSTKSGVVVINDEGVVTSSNACSGRMFGNMVGRPYEQFQEIAPYIKQVMETKIRLENEQLRYVDRSGSMTTCLIDALPLLDESNDFSGVFVQFRDISELKRIEQAEKLALVGQMAAGVAHEIRNPLSVVKGFVQYIGETHRSTATFCQQMLIEIDRINFIVGEFLVLSKPQATIFRRERLATLIHDCVTLFQPEALLHNVELVVDEIDPYIGIECDANQMKQVFINVFKNGLEAMNKKGRITIRVYRSQYVVSIQVTDEGSGMTKEQLAKVGQPFYTTKEDGTGLGIMVSRRIIASHRGQLTFHSEENRGTTVELVMPYTAQ